MKLDIRFNKELGKKLNHYIKNHEEEVKQTMVKAVSLVEGTSKEKAPVITSDLRNNINSKVEKREGIITGSVYVNRSVPYRFYVHEGTGLFARHFTNAKTIPWRYKIGEQWYTSSGQKPQPFLEDALKQERNRIRNMFRKMLTKGGTT